jgi:hypothetical protein
MGGGCALSVDIISPHRRLVNVHLDSLGDTLPTKQVEILVNLLREPGCGGGLIAGSRWEISTSLAPRIMLSSTKTDWWMRGLHCMERKGLMVGSGGGTT